MERKRQNFFKLPALVIMCALFGFALYALFPQQSVFENMDYKHKPDALSIAYPNVLLHADPDNVPLRIHYVRLLRETGQLDKAQTALAPLMTLEPVPYGAFAEHLQLLARQVFAVPDGADREARRLALFASTMSSLDQGYSARQLADLLDPADDWLKAGQYLALMKERFSRSTRPQRQPELVRRLAELQESEGEVAAAARTLARHLDMDIQLSREALISEIIRVQLAADRPGAALQVFREHFARPDMTSARLREGIRMARFAGTEDLLLSWLQQLAGREPDNLPIQRELLHSQLAAGKIEASLITAQRLQRHPQQLYAADWRSIAQVLEWNGQPGEALPIWIRLYKSNGDPSAYNRAQSLAQALYDLPALSNLLEMARTRNQLGAAGYLTLADSLIQEGKTDLARAQLQESVKRYPEASDLQDRLLSLMVDMRDYEAAIALIENRDRNTGAERVQLATLYWQTRQPEKAFNQLDFSADDPAIQATIDTLRLQLGSYLGRDKSLRRDYERMLAEAEDASDDTTQQLLGLAVRFQDYPQAVRLSDIRYQQTGDPRHLGTIAEYQAALEHWPELEQTLERWADASAATARSAPYWTLQALVHQHNDNVVAADQAYAKAYELAPDDDILISRGWLQLARPEQFADTLPRLLARLTRQPSPQAYPVLAYGYSTLNDPQAARQWFLAGLPKHDGDSSWLLSTARVLEQTGSPLTARNLRRSVASAAATQNEGPVPSATERLALYQLLDQRRLAWQTLASLDVPGTGSAAATRDTIDRNKAGQVAAFALDQGNAALAEAQLPNLAGSAQKDLANQLRPRPGRGDEQLQRLNRQLDRLTTPLTAEERKGLLRDTVQLARNFPSGLQVGHQWQGLGNFTVQRTGIAGRYHFDRALVGFNLDSIRADDSGRLRQRPATRPEARLLLAHSGPEFGWQATLEQLPRYEDNSLAGSLEGTWQGTDAWSLTAGIERNTRTPDSAEAWWLTGRDREYIGATYTPFSRLSLTSQLGHLSIDDVEGSSLGSGYNLDLAGTYTVFRNDPAWTVSAGYQCQQIDLEEDLPKPINDALAQPLQPDELLTETYERVGITTRWFHGELHDFSHSAPSPRAFLGFSGGYVLSTASPDFGIDFGLGWRLLGDDELAFSGRWSSEGLDGSGRVDINLTYSLFIGR